MAHGLGARWQSLCLLVPRVWRPRASWGPRWAVGGTFSGSLALQRGPAGCEVTVRWPLLHQSCLSPSRLGLDLLSSRFYPRRLCSQAHAHLKCCFNKRLLGFLETSHVVNTQCLFSGTHEMHLSRQVQKPCPSQIKKIVSATTAQQMLGLFLTVFQDAV